MNVWCVCVGGRTCCCSWYVRKVAKKGQSVPPRHSNVVVVVVVLGLSCGCCVVVGLAVGWLDGLLVDGG